MPETYGIENQPHEDARWANWARQEEYASEQRRIARARVLMQKGYGEDAIMVALDDARYEHFSAYVAPWDWRISATSREVSIGFIIEQLLAMGRGYDRARLVGLARAMREAMGDNAYTHSDEVEQEAVLGDLNAPEPVARQDLEPWLRDLSAEELAENGIRVEDTSVTRRPETLVGVRHTEGRPDRFGKSAAYARQRREQKRQALGRTPKEPK